MPDTTTFIRRPQRWDVPFWRERKDDPACEVTEAKADELLALPLFQALEPARFSASSPLRGILMNDARVRRFSPGEIVVRQGDYGNSAFIILSGAARVILDTVDEALMGRHQPRRPGFFEALAQLWNRPALPEVRAYETAETADRRVRAVSGGVGGVGDTAIFVQDVTSILTGKRTAVLTAGELFGEIAALSRTPRTTTVAVDGPAEMLEIRWQGLREIRLRCPEFKAYVDRLYRERSLKTHLGETAMFKHLDEAQLDQVAAATEFLTFGDFDWYAAFTKQRQATAAERLRHEPLVAQQGHYPNGVYLIRSGFARLSETYNHGERTVSYLGRGQVFGFEEVAVNWRRGAQLAFRQTLRALGYVDVLFVPTRVVETIVLPTLPAALLPAGAETAERPAAARAKEPRIRPEMMEFIVDRRLLNGTATMIIDLERCTRCDDCVRACAATHQNNPRFIRHGAVQDGFMIANACMHCLDPICMIGCPTGAIHREAAQGRVVINDTTCIGCATCANSCPYDNIQMVTPRDREGRPYYDQTTNQPWQKAAKCDLCASQLTGPACEQACPHDALKRVDMRGIENLAGLFRRR